MAILSKQLLLEVTFRLEMLTEAVVEAPGFIIIIIEPSAMLKVKLSIGEGMPLLMLLIVAVAIALQLPVRLLSVRLLPVTLKRLLPIAPHPASTKTRVADSKRNNHVLRISLNLLAWADGSIPKGRHSPAPRWRPYQRFVVVPVEVIFQSPFSHPFVKNRQCELDRLNQPAENDPTDALYGS